MAPIGNGVRLNGNPMRTHGGVNVFSGVRHARNQYGSKKNFFIGRGTSTTSSASGSSVWTYGDCVLNTTSKFSLTSWAPTMTGALSPGHVGILQIAFDNITAADGDNSEVTSITDAAGNTWTKAKEYTKNSGGVANGVTTSLWYSNITSTLKIGDAITINFSGAGTTAKALQIHRFLCTPGASASIVASGTDGQVATDPGSINISPSSGSREHLYFRAIGIEDVQGVGTPTSGYTLTNDTATTGGIPTSNIWGIGEYKIETSTSSTSDPTFVAKDNASVFVAFDLSNGTLTTTRSTANIVGSQPSGVNPHYSWFFAPKAGGLASRYMITGTGTIAGDFYTGKDLSASLSGTGSISSAPLSLTTGLSASLSGTGTITVDADSIIGLSADLSGSSSVTADLSALSGLSASLSGSGSITASLSGTCELSADITVAAASDECPTADQVATAVAPAVWQYIIEAGFSAEEILRLMAALQLGQSSGGPTTPVYVGLDGATDRVTGTTDTDGNRTSITLDAG